MKFCRRKHQWAILTATAIQTILKVFKTFSLPFLRNGKYRAFPAKGDSMPPFKDGTFIVGKYVEEISDLKTDKTYIFITIHDGIIYKRFQFHEGNSVCVKSDNTFYEAYYIPLSEIYEIWEFVCSISTEEYAPGKLSQHNIQTMFSEIKSDLKNINERINFKK